MSLALSDPASIPTATTADSGARATAEHSPSSAPVETSARERLLEHLRNPSGDHEADHSRADGLLLDALGDEEVTAAWYGVSGSWWYA